MSLDQERKRFEERCGYSKSETLQRWLTFSDGKYLPLADYQSIHSQKLADRLNMLFSIWVLAKEDAKPVVEPVLRGTHVGTAWTYPGARGGMTFKTKELAIADALAHGYRQEPKRQCALIKCKGTDDWHVCELRDRVWTGVSPYFKSNREAANWAMVNDYEVQE